MKLSNKIKKYFNTILPFSQKESATRRVIYSGSSPVQWTPQDYENYAKEAYLKNVISFRCIDIIAKSVASVPWEIKKELGRGNIAVDFEHPLNKIIKRPNPDTCWPFLMVQSIGYLLISGNLFYEKITPETGPNTKVVKELYALRPDRMKILVDPDKGRLKGYEYTFNSKPTTWLKDPITGDCDITHIKCFHPIDDYWGAAVTEPAAREIDTSNEATRWNKHLLENEGRPGLIFTVGGFLTDEQYDRLEKMLQENVSGATNARKNLIVEGEKASVLPYGWNPAELDFMEGSRELCRKIAFAYGVPPMLVGIPGDNTFSNYKEARMAFWEDTIIFYLNLLKNELTAGLLKEEEDHFFDYDLNDIPALAPKREKKWEMAERSDFLEYNEKRRLAGFEERPDCGVILVPTTSVPIEMAGKLAMAQVESQNKPQGDQGGGTPPPKVPKKEEEEFDTKDIQRDAEPVEEKPLPNEFSCRLRDPNQYTSFARKNNAGKVDGKRIDFIFGIKGKKSERQAIRYPKSEWSKAEAQSHCNTHDHISFE